jgi:hypothetical protein
MDLREFRATVLRLDSPEGVLRLADEYLQEFEKKGDRFILPSDHALVKPVLETYRNDLAGWVKFVKGIRDRLPVDGRKFHAGVHDLYRTLLVRLTQHERRVRLDAAVAKAVQKGMIENEFEAKMRYSRRCTQVWKQRKDNLLRQHAKSSKKGVLSVEERDGILEQYWQLVNEEIEHGELPKP